MSKGNSKVWIGGAVAASVLLLAAGYFVGVEPQMSQAATARQQTEQTNSQVAVLQTKVKTLKAQQARMAEYQAELATVQQAMPERHSGAAVVNKLKAMSEAARVNLRSLSPSLIAAANTSTAAGAAGANDKTVGLQALPIDFVVDGDFNTLRAFLDEVQAANGQSPAPAMLIESIDIATSGTDDTKAKNPLTLRVSGKLFTFDANAAATAKSTTPAS